jgi:hypothetical protein
MPSFDRLVLLISDNFHRFVFGGTRKCEMGILIGGF